MKRILVLVFLPVFSCAHAQITESFADGDYTNGITWWGSSGAWVVSSGSDVAAGAPGSFTLRLNAPTGSGVKYLSTQLAGPWGSSQQWIFWMGRRAQAATSANTSYFWLFASEADVSAPTADGYRIRFGDDAASGDKLILEYISNGIPVPVLTSAGTIPNGITDFGILVRINRTATGNWSLYTSVLPTASGTGLTASALPNIVNTPVFQGMASHTILSSLENGFISMAALHSTGTTARTGAEFDQLAFQFTEGSALPVHFEEFKAVGTNGAIQIQWTNSTEENVTGYALEKSDDGQDFSLISYVQPKSNNGGSVRYEYTDTQPLRTKRYYRVRATETNGRVYYSGIIRIQPSGLPGRMNLYPNPVQGDWVGLSIGNLASGKYVLRIRSVSGQTMYSRQFIHTRGGFSTSIVIGHPPSGVYLVSLEGPEKYYKQFVVQ